VVSGKNDEESKKEDSAALLARQSVVMEGWMEGWEG